jgi:hypothetical protein
MSGIDFDGSLAPADATTLTIASGVITVIQVKHIIAAQTGTTDDLDTINVDSTIGAGYEGIIILKADAGDTITLKHETGNISLPGGFDINLTGEALLIMVDNGTNWVPSYWQPAASVLVDSGQETSDAATVNVTGWTDPGFTISKLVLEVWGLETDRAAQFFDNVLIQFNADTAAGSYNTGHTGGNSDAAFSADVVGTIAGIQLLTAAAAANSDAGCFGFFTLTIWYPGNTSEKTHCSWECHLRAETDNEYADAWGSGHWETTDAITAILFKPENGTTFLVGGANEPSELNWRLTANR